MENSNDNIVALSAKPSLSIAEASAWTGIPQTTLFRLWKEGDGPRSFKIGKRRFMLRDDLVAWLQSRPAA